MRKKSAIWLDENQAYILDKYNEGIAVPEILDLLEQRGLKTSEFTLRSVLKENGIKADWRMPVRKPELWDEALVREIINLRNQGLSFLAISKEISSSKPEIKVPKSTVVRILEKNSSAVTYQPYKQGDEIPLEIKNRIIKLYQDENTIRNILAHPEIVPYSLNSRVIRRLLKENKISLTGKKGNLRRWSDELQQKVVDLHLEGKTFEEIKKDKDISSNNPTDYAIRVILKNRGVITRQVSTYKDEIDESRYRAYRDGRLKEKDVAMVHKHLAFSEEGRELMLRRMKLNLGKQTVDERFYKEIPEALFENISAWRGFFCWSVQYLYDDGLKKEVFKTGVALGKAMRYLLKAIESGDKLKREKGWSRLEEVSSEMERIYDIFLGAPARSFRLKDINRELC